MFLNIESYTYMQKTKRMFFIFSHLAIGLLIAQSFFLYILVKPANVDRAQITNISGTLSNPRRSFFGSLDTLHEAGDNTITIDAAGTGPEVNMEHLFPGDIVSIGDNPTNTVSAVPSDTGLNFVIDAGLTVGGNDDDPVYATQSGLLTVQFTTGSDIEANGYVILTIPDPTANGNDGGPDSYAMANNGFDLNNMTTASNLRVSGDATCNNGNWSGTETLVAHDTAGHTYKALTQGTCTNGSVVTIYVGETQGLINPARSTGTALGTADRYEFTLTTYDSNDIEIETRDFYVAVVEGVLVSASVDETLTFTVAGIDADSGDYCGATHTASSPDATATQVPWGTLSTTYLEATHNAAQQLTVSTNADNGYEVYVQESDQMGLYGNTCTGTAPSDATDYNFSGATCIRDTLCAGTACTQVVAREWGADPSSYPGLGYSLENVSGAGTDVEFIYDSNNDPCDAAGSGGNFCAKQFADDQGGEDETVDGAEIMSNSSVVSGNSGYVCFRIDLPGVQPAGYYYNVVKYTAVPTF